MRGSMRYLQDDGGMNRWVAVGGTSILRVLYVIKSHWIADIPCNKQEGNGLIDLRAKTAV